MGVYVYRVTAKRVKLSNGAEANVAVYAYKPYTGLSGSAENRKMHFGSGAQASDNMAARGNVSDYIVMGDDNGKPYLPSRVFRNAGKLGTFYDWNEPGGTAFPREPELRLANEPEPTK